MANEELVRYFKEGMDRGASSVQLKNNLLDSGWSKTEIVDAFNEYVTGIKTTTHSLKFDYKILIIVAVVFVLIGAVILFSNLNSDGLVLTKSDLSSGKYVELVRKPVIIDLDGKVSTLTLDSTYSNYARINVNGVVIKIEKTERKLDLNFDGVNDILIRIDKIKSGIPTIYLRLFEKKDVVNESNSSLDDFKIPENFTIYLNGSCVENWACTIWSNCTNNKEVRTCVDNAGCNTTLKKPSVSRNCGTDEYGCFIEDDACFEPEGFFCDEGWDADEYDPYCCSGRCLEFDLDDFCSEKSVIGTDYSYFENNVTHFCSNSTLFPFNGSMISCCKEGYVVENNSAVVNNTLLDGESVDSEIIVNIFKDNYSIDEYPIGNYSVSIIQSNINTTRLMCYSKDSLRYCDNEISDSMAFVTIGDLSGFYIDDEGYSELNFDGFNVTGDYKYEYYVYLCRVVNDKLGVSDCVVSENEIGGALDGWEYDYGYGAVSVI
ncbi:MAG: hypothetical protein PF542_06970 [Nanoarchaeota archaeon]|jgi:hypothetical protein|nr:hypothetical protein [Nanoarchaeota archaeon]